MQGNCTGPPPAALEAGFAAPPLPPLLPGQCLLSSPVNIIAVRGMLWLDSFVLRAVSRPDVRNATAAGPAAAEASREDAADVRPEDAPRLVTVSDVPGGGELWMTRCSLQGSAQGASGAGGGAVVGLHVDGRAFADGAALLLLCRSLPTAAGVPADVL